MKEETYIFCNKLFSFEAIITNRNLETVGEGRYVMLFRIISVVFLYEDLPE